MLRRFVEFWVVVEVGRDLALAVRGWRACRDAHACRFLSHVGRFYTHPARKRARGAAAGGYGCGIGGREMLERGYVERPQLVSIATERPPESMSNALGGFSVQTRGALGFSRSARRIAWIFSRMSAAKSNSTNVARSIVSAGQK